MLAMQVTEQHPTDSAALEAMRKLRARPDYLDAVLFPGHVARVYLRASPEHAAAVWPSFIRVVDWQPVCDLHRIGVSSLRLADSAGRLSACAARLASIGGSK